MTFEKALLVGREPAMDERERGVAAEDHASFAPETIIESARETFDADNRRHPERDAEEKDA